ncbi:Winged helix-turn-helix DNA-binding domain,Eukaryotic translation initiation factor 3 subunit [Cinara cedri]|uniref:Eukaryotic translation initiation factor 3 subunit E n=1 Tax=Cinara cedri TaxID=506608 RepID=A0A5E4M5B9_9HEMI|nr:Winged helix-turn-helix DNA-binding domain,Eukaryotic translation initiation factor 3 subunit [Cinara cedri]
MIDYVIENYKKLNPNKEVPMEMKTKREEILSQIHQLRGELNINMDFLGDDKVMKIMESMKSSKTLINYMTEVFDFKIEMMDDMYKYAKCQYDCGNYAGTTSYLYFYLLVMPPTDKNYLNALWGKLASEILIQNWDTALIDLNRLQEFIDNNIKNSPIYLLHQRTWLIHWSLFIFFNHENGHNLIVNLFLYKPKYLNAIQTICPHILRYLAAAIIINRSKPAMKDLIKVIQQESYAYHDPITEFLENLFIQFDFEGARDKLYECQNIILNDFFLTTYIGDFVENARLMIFETFCRIHQCISISMLAKNLNMNLEDAECWIVNLIRNTKLDAKVDSEVGLVIMETQSSPYEQIIDQIDKLSIRSQALTNLVERNLIDRV